jgi:asparagine synthase (glutamine-hydrolysing)
MFAIAILDTDACRLILARDASGMKPLYWTRSPAGFVFASEVKALAASGFVSLKPDAAGLDAFLTTGFVPSPGTCFEGIERLPAGEYLTVQASGETRETFWRLRFNADSPPKDDREYARELERLLRAAVQSHLDADVPVGAFVSGGWDSSLVATLAAEYSPRTLKTFSLIFPDDPDMDESRFSRELAQRLKTDHHEVEYRGSQIPDLLPKTVRSLEEPSTAGPALLGFHLASEAAREVKAVVMGEGSDELFGGYVWLRSSAYYRLRPFVPRLAARLMQGAVSDPRAVRALGVLAAEDEPAADVEWFRAFTNSQKDLLLNPEWRSHLPDNAVFRTHPDTLSSCSDRLQRRLSLDFTRRLSDGILLINDKVSMAHSLEARMPFLDRRLLDFASVLPSTMKIRGGQEKYVLSLLASLLPAQIARRRKFGLGYPKCALLKEPVRSFSEQVLLDSAEPGPFRRKSIEGVLQQVRAGRRESGRLLWMLLTVQCWWNEFF